MTSNIFENIPTDSPEELFVSLLKTSNIRIERIVSYGQASPDGFWYDQEEHKWIILLKGAARLTVDASTVEVRQGDYLNIPSHTNHRKNGPRLISQRFGWVCFMGLGWSRLRFSKPPLLNRHPPLVDNVGNIRCREHWMIL